MDALQGKYAKQGVCRLVHAYLAHVEIPKSTKQISGALGIPYSTVTNSIKSLVANNDLELAFEKRNPENLRATPQKFYRLPKKESSTKLPFPWKINPKGYNNGYETQPC